MDAGNEVWMHGPGKDGIFCDKMALDVPDCCENALRGFLFKIGCEPGTHTLLLMSQTTGGECKHFAFLVYLQCLWPVIFDLHTVAKDICREIFRICRVLVVR